MSAKKVEQGKTMGLAIIVASVVACAAIVGASAMVVRRPPPREDFLALVPEKKPRRPVPAVGTDEEEASAAEEEPRPAELVARAEKLIAEGSRDRGRIEGLLLGATKARPGGDDSIKAFRLLWSLHEKWREEDAKRERPEPAPTLGTEKPAETLAPSPLPPLEVPRPPAVPPAPPTPGFVSLIGSDLSDWGTPSGGKWKVRKRGILAKGLNVVGYLYTRRRFRNFTLRLKASAVATSEADPHLKVRFRWVPEKGRRGCQVDLCRKVYFYGNVEDAEDSERVYNIPHDLSLKIGSSVDVELVAVGKSVMMLVNGKPVFSETTEITEPGELGICAHRSTVLFERVEIKEH